MSQIDGTQKSQLAPRNHGSRLRAKRVKSPGEGQKLKASVWAFVMKNPPRRSTPFFPGGNFTCFHFFHDLRQTSGVRRSDRRYQGSAEEGSTKTAPFWIQ